MGTNKKTRKISSDKIFYAVLKSGTIINNVKSLLDIDMQDVLQSLYVKLFSANMDILKSFKNYAYKGEKLRLLIDFLVALRLSEESNKDLIEELKLEFKQVAEQ